MPLGSRGRAIAATAPSGVENAEAAPWMVIAQPALTIPLKAFAQGLRRGAAGAETPAPSQFRDHELDEISNEPGLTA